MIFFPENDTVAVVVNSISSFASVFYSTDSCFDFSWGETYNYHYHLVGVANPMQGDVTIPESYSTIGDLSKAGAFHLLSLMRYSFDQCGFPNLQVPIYYSDIDSCVDKSSFNSFTQNDVPGIKIRGNVGDNDWDQWDSTVILHELGHAFMDQNSGLARFGGDHWYFQPSIDSVLKLAYGEGWVFFSPVWQILINI
ncbi:MAG: hypothetical protein ABIJ45_06600 [Candidatus Zixiibacteriota bacterium]